MRTSAMVEHQGSTVVIDTGPDFRQQMLRAKPHDVDAVLYTHEHKDHIAGLDDIRPFNFKHRKALDIYATPVVQEAIHREFHYVFADLKYPGIPEVKLHTIAAGEPFVIGQLSVEPLEVFHYKMPVLAFRMGSLAYVTDANHIPPAAMERLRGLDVLVLNALRKQTHISHFNLEQAVELCGRLGARRTYLTHISHLMGLHQEVSRELPPNVYLAYDGLVVELP